MQACNIEKLERRRKSLYIEAPEALWVEVGDKTSASLRGRGEKMVIQSID